MSTWREEFNKARAAGQGIFTYGGKTYNTMDKNDNIEEFRSQHKDFDTYLQQVGMSRGNTLANGQAAVGAEWNPTTQQRMKFEAQNLSHSPITKSDRVEVTANGTPRLKTTAFNQPNVNSSSKAMSTNLNISKGLNLNLNRKQTRQAMRSAGMNPYSYSGAQRKELRSYLNGNTATKPSFLAERSNVAQSTTQNTGVPTNTKTSTDYFVNNLVKKNLNI